MTAVRPDAARLAVGIVGTGRVGAVLAAALARAGHDVVAASAVSEASKARAAELLPGVVLLTPDEVRALDGGWRPDDAFWAARHAERARHEQWDPPDLLGAREDADRWRRAPSGTTPGSRPRLRGLGLTTGTVTGRAWVLRTPSTELPQGWDPASTVLVARAVDAGWIPTFALVAAVVVETGGDLSHGSIILREIGLPAVTNVTGATSTIASGTFVEVRARPGVIVLGSSGG